MQTYTIADWLADWTFFAEASNDPEGQKIDALPLGLKYFREKYQDDYLDRFVRFQKAQEFLSEYAERFDHSNTAMAAPTGGRMAVGEPLVRALHHHFSRLPESELINPQPVEAIVSLLGEV